MIRNEQLNHAIRVAANPSAVAIGDSCFPERSTGSLAVQEASTG